jgi:citrate lyase beta subunit
VTPNCWLYVPGNRPDRIAKAIQTSADAIIIDLEDACPSAEKASARRSLADLAGGWPVGRCYVRVNAMDSGEALADLEAVVRPGVAGIVLPKSETAEQLRTADWAVRARRRLSAACPFDRNRARRRQSSDDNRAAAIARASAYFRGRRLHHRSRNCLVVGRGGALRRSS